MKSLYSIAIHPPDNLITLVKTMKEELSAEIGWFNSKNSIAHITVNEFEAEDFEIEGISTKLSLLCDSIPPIPVGFNALKTYPSNGAFFMAPDEVSKKNLKVVMKYLNDNIHVVSRIKSTDPHLSIARKLDEQKIRVAHHLFPSFDMHCTFENVVVRKFNTTRKQFDIIKVCKFSGTNPLLEPQMRLFD